MAAKFIVKVGPDFFRVAENILKLFKGSKDVVKSSQKAATDAGRTIKNASQSTIQHKAHLNKLSRANKADVTRKGLLEAKQKTSKIDLKSHPSLKNGKIKTKTKPTNGTKIKTKTTNGTKIKTKTTNGTKIKTPKKVNPWKTTSSTQAQKLRAADVAKGRKITSTNAVSGNIAMRGAKKLGNVVTKGSKKFIKTKTGKLIAIGGGLAGVHYIGKAIDKKIAGTNGAAATTKPPKPPAASSTTGSVTTALAPPSVLSAQEQTANQTKPPKPKPPKPPAALMAGRPEDRKSRDVAADMRHFAISKGGTQDDPNRGFRRRLFGKDVSEAKAKKDMEAAYKREQDDRYETPNKLVEKDKYKYGTGRRSQLKGKQGKKKGGSVIKRNKGGPVRGVGKALRGYGNNSSYSNKMY